MKLLRVLFALLITLMMPVQGALAAGAGGLGMSNCSDSATSPAATPILTTPPDVNPDSPTTGDTARTTPLDFTAFTADASIWMCDYFQVANDLQIKDMIDTISITLFVLFLTLGLVRASGNTKEQLGIVIRGCVASIVIFTMTGSNGSQIRQTMHDGWVGTYEYSTSKARDVIQTSIEQASKGVYDEIGKGLLTASSVVGGGGLVKSLLTGALKVSETAAVGAAAKTGMADTEAGLMAKLKTGSKQVESLQKSLSFMYYATIPYIFFFSLTVFISGLTVILAYTLLPLAAALYVGNNLTALRGVFASYIGAILLVLIMPFAHTLAIKIGYVQPMNAIATAVKINNEKHNQYETALANDTMQANKDLVVALATGKADVIDAAAGALRTAAAGASQVASVAIGNTQNLLIQIIMGIAFLIMGMAMGTTIMGYMANFVLRLVGSGGISARNAPNMPRIGMGGKSGGKDTGKGGKDKGGATPAAGGPGATSGGSGSGGPGGGGSGTGGSGSGAPPGGNAPGATGGALAASSAGGSSAGGSGSGAPAGGGASKSAGGGSLQNTPHTSGANASSWKSSAQGASNQMKPATGRTDNPASAPAASAPAGNTPAVNQQGGGRFGRAAGAANEANSRSAESRTASTQAAAASQAQQAQAQAEQARSAREQQGAQTAGSTREGRYNRQMSERDASGNVVEKSQAQPSSSRASSASTSSNTSTPAASGATPASSAGSSQPARRPNKMTVRRPKN